MGAFARTREQLATVTAAAQDLPRNLLIIAIAAGAALVLALMAIAVAARANRVLNRLAAAGG